AVESPSTVRVGQAGFGLQAQAVAALLDSQLGHDPRTIEAAPALTLAVVGNTRGEVDICDCPEKIGGLGRRATIIKELRATASPLFVFDVGDALSDNIAAPPKRDNSAAVTRAEGIVDAFGKMKI